MYTRRPHLPFLALALLITLLSQASASFYHVERLNETDANGCRAGQEFLAGNCNACRPGTYRFIALSGEPTRQPFTCPRDRDFRIEATTASCKPCPAGTFNPYYGGKASSVCHACPAGTTSARGATRCRPCPGAQQSSSAGSGVCATCPKGSFLTAPCVPGNKPASPCSKCAIGSYSSSRNSLGCTACPGGFTTAKAGATSKTQCHPCGVRGVKCSCRQRTAGEPWNQVASYRLKGSDECVRCPSGTRARTPFATAPDQCVKCPAGTAYNENSCRTCPAGTRSFGRGAAACRATSAASCPRGKKKNGDGVCVDNIEHDVCLQMDLSDGRCLQCPKGFRIDAATGRCEMCSAGTFSFGWQTTCDATCNFPLVNPPAQGMRHCYCARNYRFDNYFNRCVKCEMGSAIDERAHLTTRCKADCDKFPYRFDECTKPKCKKQGFGRVSDTSGCKRCPQGTAVRQGSVYCTKKEDGCLKGMFLGVGYLRFGEQVTCFDPKEW